MASGGTFSLCSILLIVIVGVLVGFTGSSSAQLSTNFYSESCPTVFYAVKSVVQSAVNKEKRMGASLLRLHFHDCFVNGCDGSLLLDDTSSFTGEKTARPNNNSVRGYEVVDKIKYQVEKTCPGVVSCADILTIAARDSVQILGGPSWNVKLGRRDSKTASLDAANSGVLPSSTANLTQLKTTFQDVGLNERDLVALSGGHTIGQARCRTFRARIYNETNIDAPFAKARQSKCPEPVGSGDDNLAPFDVQTPNTFDTAYYTNLINQKGLLHSDQVLYNNGGSTDSLVKTYSGSAKTFNSDFANAMIKMGDIKPLTGSKGEIRLNCRRPN